MLWECICRNLKTKKLLPVLGILCLVVVVFDFIMLARVKGSYISRTYRTMETSLYTNSDSDITNNNTKTSMIADKVNLTSSFKRLMKSVANFGKFNILQSNLTIYDKRYEDVNKTFQIYNNKLTNLPPSPSSAPSVRPENCTDCFKHNFNFTLNNENICKMSLENASQELSLLILIFTAHARREQRDAIRDTWITYTRNNTGNVRYVFLLGLTNKPALNQAVLEENRLHADMIQENFTDSYQNLTYKTMMGFRWTLTNCAHARFVFKTDDDMYVNVPVLVNLAHTHAESLQSAVGGACFLANQRPIRSNFSKWYASNASYPQEFYPGFCSGTGYITSILVVRKVFEISKNVPFFHLEDIYVALCLKMLGYKLLPLYGFHNHKVRIDYCNYKSAFVVTSHELSPDLLRLVWTSKCKPYNLGMRLMGFVVAITFFIIMLLCSLVQ